MITPDLFGETFELQFVDVQDDYTRGGHDPDTCEHRMVIFFTKDDGRYCGCQDCGAVWQVIRKENTA